jgi:hypothetical protein
MAGIIPAVKAMLLRTGLALVVSLCFATPAVAMIHPGRGIAGVSLWMTESQVRATMGAPLQITRWRGALGSPVARFHYRRLDVDLQRLNTKPVVIRILTTRAAERTASGVGVGSRLAAVERLRGARCFREGSTRYCRIGSRDKPLSPFTMFWLGSDRRVTLVSVSLTVNA